MRFEPVFVLVWTAALVYVAVKLRWLAEEQRRLSTHILRTIQREGKKDMALGEDILAKVTAQGTAIGSIKTLIEGLVTNSVIPASVGDAINAALSGNTAELAAIEAALLANVTPPPTP